MFGGQEVLSIAGAWKWAGFVSEKRKAVGIPVLAYNHMVWAML